MSSQKDKSQESFERLPTTVVPLVYQVKLRPDWSNFTVHGWEMVHLKVNQSTGVITLNAREINVLAESVSVADDQGTVILLDNISYNIEKDTVTFQFRDMIPSGDARLCFEYNAKINTDKLCGFYASRYTGPDGVPRLIGCTHFEATDARRAFPCWDEPAIKANFDLSLIIAADGKTLALSNMSVREEVQLDQQLKLVHFKRTPLMSTYLVAFVVGELQFLKSQCSSCRYQGQGVEVRVYTPVGKREQGEFALEMSTKALDFYTEYFNIPYPLDKLDLVAIPDFAMGAMENWGLVTYREICLLVDPQNTSTCRKQAIALTVAHELAHQWFGNLVTMQWWTHLWLNEGFASFMECLCVDKLFPHWDIWTQFVSNVFLRAMQLDALDSSHSIEIPVGHPSEINEIFDAISYCKGASVIRQLHRYIGDEAFRKGMSLYLNRFSYRNALTEDLWAALEEVSKKPVSKVMTTWTKQKGFPLVLVDLQKEVKSTDTSQVIRVSQEKFCLKASNVNTKEICTQIWGIPLSIISRSSPVKPVRYWLFDKPKWTFSLEVCQDEWFKLNASTVGFYRVWYSPPLLHRFTAAIADQTIPALDRLGLISDMFALVLAGRYSAVELFSFILHSFHSECNYAVWAVLAAVLDKFGQLFAHSKLIEPFRKFGLHLLSSSIYPSLGWDPKPSEPYLDTMLRSLVINLLVELEHPQVITRCRELFQNRDQKTIPVDLRAPIYRCVSRQADEIAFEELLKLYGETDLQEEKNRISSSLGHVKSAQLIHKVLDFAISDHVRSQDAIFVIGNVASNPVGREAAWQFFQAHRQLWISRYGSGGLLCRLIKLVTENFVTEEKAIDVERYFRENKFPGAELSVRQGVESIRVNSAVMQRDADKVERYLLQFQ